MIEQYFKVADLRIKVTERGGGTLPHYVDDPCGEGGRGLPILQALAQDWGFEVQRNGRVTVWFDLAVTTS
ncbi:ATP-binding protein [Actinoallomurus rhizosphaericola]|uniref:hypothetical protein n=1 Tax=Actinoallomurus rhizosphaericola TaxID=2952536 RepID=UPI0020906E87|nr:hypothetical protein [Actinoallomurus rhizosphaericola]MCO5994727.1 hypothetical protein [Actinoallomurus rhizosphaericola]